MPWKTLFTFFKNTHKNTLQNQIIFQIYLFFLPLLIELILFREVSTALSLISIRIATAIIITIPINP